MRGKYLIEMYCAIIASTASYSVSSTVAMSKKSRKPSMKVMENVET